MTTRQGAFISLGNWLQDYWIAACLAICQVVFLACCLFLTDEVLNLLFDPAYHQAIEKYTFIIIVITFVLGAIFWILNLKHTARLTKLEEQKSDLETERGVLVENVENLIEGYLVRLASAKFNFGSRQDCSDRITLFSHDEDGGQFVLVGRYSPNPTLHKTKRRFTYPDTEGCLATAWRIGSHFIDGLPDPASSIDDYATRQQTDCGFPEDQARQLTMKSRLYYSYRVMDTRGRNPIAAVVIESTAPNRFTRVQLDQVFNNDERRFMSDLLEVVKPHLTIPSDAQKVGL